MRQSSLQRPTNSGLWNWRHGANGRQRLPLNKNIGFRRHILRTGQSEFIFVFTIAMFFYAFVFLIGFYSTYLLLLNYYKNEKVTVRYIQF